MNYLSVCSGIEAATVAWHGLGWTAVGFAEIDKFASAVLAERFGSNMPGEPLAKNGVPNFGDFTVIDLDQVGLVDLLVGGTPCQAFSFAGKRQSLADARGNLTLAYAVLAHELARSHGLKNALWENVPGVLSTEDNAFGCFLGALIGADDAVPVPKGVERWPDAGMVAGPRARAAWRLLDAQYFGLAQRRERVFVVVDFGNGADPAAVLFEPQGVSGNIAPSREAGQRPAGTLSARTEGGGGLGTDFDLDGGVQAYRLYTANDDVIEAAKAVNLSATLNASCDRIGNTGTQVIAYGGNNTAGPIDVATALNAHGGPAGRQDFESETFIVGAMQSGCTPNGHGGAGINSQLVDAGYVIPVIAATLTRGAESQGKGGYAGRRREDDVNLIAFDTTQITSKSNFSNPKDGDPCHPLAATAHPPAVAYSIMPQNSGKDYKAREVEVAQPVMAGGPVGGNQGGDYIVQPVAAYDLRSREGGSQFEGPHDTANMRAASGGSSRSYVQQGWAVRRLTTVECARLQGFPDHHSRIAWRGKPAEQCPDGPQYKTYGNSMAVKNMRWLGERIQLFMPITN